jgi:hypothetical protein
MGSATYTSIEPVVESRDNDRYEDFLAAIQQHFSGQTTGVTRLFTTDATDLFTTFLSYLPDSARQHYNCHACRRFFERYAGLVTITPAGEKVPVICGDFKVPPTFYESLRALRKQVRRANVTGVFLSSDPVWGTPECGGWVHTHVVPGSHLLFKSLTQSASQAMAEKTEDASILTRSLAEYQIETVAKALTALRDGTLFRSEKAVNAAEWLYNLHETLGQTPTTKRCINILWRAVATAPAGYCHVRNNMIGTLLDDIQAELPFETIKRRWAEKMDPLQYQRPQAAPVAGNIAQAERIVEQLQAAGALRRRFATLDDIKALWKPMPPKPSRPVGDGVFAHLQPKAKEKPVQTTGADPVTMTWVKFEKTILPDAVKIEYNVRSRDSLVALVTAADPNAPPILQWDSEDERNPVSWYVYGGGSSASQWGVPSGYCEVTAICLKPSMWGNHPLNHQGNGVNFLLKGAVDSRDGGLAIFPEILKSDFHSIRSTIEAFSNRGTLEGRESANACGVMFAAGGTWNCTLRVTNMLGVESVYRLDRWD